MSFTAGTSAAVFQSPFGAEVVTVGRQPLCRDAGKLFQSVQVFNVSWNQSS